jgi:hypothetical protein
MCAPTRVQDCELVPKLLSWYLNLSWCLKISQGTYPCLLLLCPDLLQEVAEPACVCGGRAVVSRGGVESWR